VPATSVRTAAVVINLGRLLPIIIGIGLLLSWEWGADIDGLVTAVGVTSIVIGLAVQTAVGPVIAGLLLGGRDLSLGRLGVGRLHRHNRPNSIPGSRARSARRSRYGARPHPKHSPRLPRACG
jgi:hypothetical protein